MIRPKPYDPAARLQSARRRFSRDEWALMQNRPFIALTDHVDIFDEDDIPISKKKVINSEGEEIALAVWAKTKGVYRFDPTLKEAISQMDLLNTPNFVISRLPEWGIYIQLEQPITENVGGGWLHGAFVAYDDMWGDGGICLCSLITNQGVFTTDTLIYSANDHREEPSLGWMLERRTDQVDLALAPLLTEVIALAAYLCTAQPDVRDSREPRNRPLRITRSGPVRHWEVGYRFGAVFRIQLAQAEQKASRGSVEGERHRPRVHVRRAHWHSFWTGPKDGERKRIVKWLPPVIVNAEGDELPATIWRQK